MAKPPDIPNPLPDDFIETVVEHDWEILEERHRILRQKGTPPAEETAEAFLALSQTREMAREWIDADPMSVVPVPGWAVAALVDKWKRYIFDGGLATLGETFGVEGGGQGKSPERKRMSRNARDFSLARNVWMYLQEQHANGRKPSIKDEAIPEVAERFKQHGISEDIVRRAWSRYRSLVKGL